MAPLLERIAYIHAADGARLAITEVYEGRISNGPGIVLVHGFAQNRHAFDSGLLPAGFLSRGTRVFLAELRGHGRSDRPTEPWDLKTHLDLDLPAIIAAVRDWTGGVPHLAGHSMGGMLGYASLTKRLEIASLTTFCAPMILGATRNAVRAASLVAPLIAMSSSSVPMDRFLRLVSKPLTRPRARFGLGAVQRFTNLVNPTIGDPEKLRAVLRDAERESPGVLRQIAAMGVHRRPEMLGIDLAAAVHFASIPVCIVVGTDDVFAPPASVAPFGAAGQAGRRRLIQIPGGSHVDVPMGHHAFRLAQDIWRFIESS